VASEGPLREASVAMRHDVCAHVVRHWQSWWLRLPPPRRPPSRRLAYAGMDAEAAAALASALRSLPALETLECVATVLPQCLLQAAVSCPRTAPSPCGPCSTCSLMPILCPRACRLANNAFGPAGMTSLAPALEGAVHLQSLKCVWHFCGAAGRPPPTPANRWRRMCQCCAFA
jgi:hypothetical protein